MTFQSLRYPRRAKESLKRVNHACRIVPYRRKRRLQELIQLKAPNGPLRVRRRPNRMQMLPPVVLLIQPRVLTHKPERSRGNRHILSIHLLSIFSMSMGYLKRMRIRYLLRGRMAVYLRVMCLHTLVRLINRILQRSLEG